MKDVGGRVCYYTGNMRKRRLISNLRSWVTAEVRTCSDFRRENRKTCIAWSTTRSFSSCLALGGRPLLVVGSNRRRLKKPGEYRFETDIRYASRQFGVKTLSTLFIPLTQDGLVDWSSSKGWYLPVEVGETPWRMLAG